MYLSHVVFLRFNRMNINIYLVKPLIVNILCVIYISIYFETRTYVKQKAVIIIISVYISTNDIFVNLLITKIHGMYGGMFVYKAVATFNKCVEFQIHQKLQQLTTSGNVLKKQPAFFACFLLFLFSLNIFGL